MHFVITDWVTGKQYSLDDYDEANCQYETCINRAKKRGYILTKGDREYITENGLQITRNWGFSTTRKEHTQEEKNDLVGDFWCVLCWNPVYEVHTFCALCKKNI